MNAAQLSTDFCTITQAAWERVRDTQGVYFEPLMEQVQACLKPNAPARQVQLTASA